MYSRAVHARLTKRMMFSPMAHTRFGVIPNSPMRAVIAASTRTSTISAAEMSAICRPSKTPGGATGSLAETEYSTRPRTTMSSASKAINISRCTSIPLPVHTRTARKDRSINVKSGVKIRVSTGATCSMAPCPDSTSQAATTNAPIAPHGMIHDATAHRRSTPSALNTISVIPVSTPPPRAMSTYRMKSCPLNRTKSMRRPRVRQSPPAYAKPTTSHRAMGTCNVASIAVSPPGSKGKTLHSSMATKKGGVNQPHRAKSIPRFHAKYAVTNGNAKKLMFSA